MEVLTISMNLFIKNFKSIAMIVAFLFFPISILNTLIDEKLSANAFILMNLSESGEFSGNMSAFTEAGKQFIENQALQMATFLFLVPVGVIAIAKIAKGYLCKETIRVRDAIGEGMNCLWAIIVAGIIYWFCMFVGGLLFVIPGLYLGVIWCFYEYAIGLKGMKGWDALKYSKKLMQGKFWKTLGFLVMLFFILLGWDLIFSGMLYFAPEHIATNIIYNTLTFISGSFAFISMTVLFMNRQAVILKEKLTPTDNVADSTIAEAKH